jgi:hypothetical protein
VEQAQVLAVLHSTRFVDRAPAQIVATLLDEGRYLCSVRTMYRARLRARRVTIDAAQLATFQVGSIRGNKGTASVAVGHRGTSQTA